MYDRLTGALAALAVGAGASAAGAADGDIHAGTHPVPGAILQVIKSFDNPEGAIFSADGSHVFVSNAAEIGDEGDTFGWTQGQGYVSKLEVQPDGRLTMVEEKLVDGLTGPLGMDVLPVATETFPAGTIFLAAGSAPMADSEGNPVTDPAELQTKLVAFNEDGEVLGEIDTGTGSMFEAINGSPVVLLNAIGFDAQGNLYFADTAFGAGQFEPAVEGKGGVWMIPHGSIDALAAGEAPETEPTFLAVPGNPDGIEVSPLNGKIYVNTVGPVGGAPDPANGGIYELSRSHFTGDQAGKLPPPLDGNLGALDGLDFTAGGAMLNTQIKPDVPQKITVNCPGERATTLALEPAGPAAELSGPADIAVRRDFGNPQLLVIPELMNRSPNTGDNEVTVVALPADFDRACSA